jgi:hypothetical protein
MSRIPEYKYKREALTEEQRKAIFRKLEWKARLYIGIAVLLIAATVFVVFAKVWRAVTNADKIHRAVERSRVSPGPATAPMRPG